MQDRFHGRPFTTWMHIPFAFMEVRNGRNPGDAGGRWIRSIGLEIYVDCNSLIHLSAYASPSLKELLKLLAVDMAVFCPSGCFLETDSSRRFNSLEIFF